jgi:hypothetical protein
MCSPCSAWPPCCRLKELSLDYIANVVLTSDLLRHLEDLPATLSEWSSPSLGEAARYMHLGSTCNGPTVVQAKRCRAGATQCSASAWQGTPRLPPRASSGAIKACGRTRYADESCLVHKEAEGAEAEPP